MTRLLSGAVLVAIVIAVVWLAPPWLLFAVGEAVLLLAVVEYAGLADASGLAVPIVPTAAAAMLASIGVTSTEWIGEYPIRSAVALDAVLMSAFVALAVLVVASARTGREALGRAAAAMLPMMYLGLPMGALIQIRSLRGPAALFLLMLTVIVSDTAQYYTGRAIGRRPLAPAISPKKTIEGALGGFLFGAATMAVAGAWWMPDTASWFRAALGLTLVALGIAGDLFESMLKRGADAKDSSGLIPGHGGILDRIDALLFAAPIYYLVLKYV